MKLCCSFENECPSGMFVLQKLYLKIKIQWLLAHSLIWRASLSLSVLDFAIASEFEQTDLLKTAILHIYILGTLHYFSSLALIVESLYLHVYCLFGIIYDVIEVKCHMTWSDWTLSS